jgi:hypothetical protein
MWQTMDLRSCYYRAAASKLALQKAHHQRLIVKAKISPSKKGTLKGALEKPTPSREPPTDPMRLITNLTNDQILMLSDKDFQDSVEDEARTSVPEAFTTYRDVMSSSDDDKARIMAADKIMSLAGIEEKEDSKLSSGISEEVFKLALAGLSQLAGVVKSASASPEVLRNVSPAKTDPRPSFTSPLELTSDSPLDRMNNQSDTESERNPYGERYEIRNREN